MLLCQTAVCCPYVCNPHEIFAKNCNNFHGVNSIKLCISRVHRQKEKDFKFFLEVLFVIAHRFCCPCALLYIARKGMYARETLVGFPLHVKLPACRRPLLRSKSPAPKRKTPVGVSFFLEQGTGIEGVLISIISYIYSVFVRIRVRISSYIPQNFLQSGN